jgi:hypothetical protein
MTLRYYSLSLVISTFPIYGTVRVVTTNVTLWHAEDCVTVAHRLHTRISNQANRQDGRQNDVHRLMMTTTVHMLLG